jgi:nucleoside-diphosphate-sugar epimerase
MTPDAAREAAGDAARVVGVNVGGTATAVEAAAAHGVRRVMLLSSVAVYGRTLPETPRLHEADTVCTPANLYGITKHAAERLALRLGTVHGVPVVAPRLGVAWGPWEHRTGARPTPSSPFQIMAQALAGKAIGIRPGTVAPLIFIEDAVSALRALLTAPIPADGVVNVGASAPSDLHALAGLIAGACAAPPPVDAEPTIALLGPGRPPMDGTRLAALTGVEPRPADDAQVAAYLDWLRSLPDPQAPFA